MAFGFNIANEIAKGTRRARGRRSRVFEGDAHSVAEHQGHITSAPEARYRAKRAARASVSFLHHSLHRLETPETALTQAQLGEQPSRLLLKTNPRAYQLAQRVRISGLDEGLKEPEDLTNAILAVSGAGDIASILRGAGEIGLKELEATAAKQAASTAASSAEKRSLADVLGGTVGKAVEKKAAAKAAVSQAARKAEPGFIKAGREAIAKRASELPTGVKVAGRAGAQGATFPVKHPLTAPFAFQAPVALAKGNPKALLEPLEGKGVEADIASAAGHISPIAGEAVSLPASVLPTAYLVGKAGLHAAGGDSKELDELKKQYLETGFLPAVFSGNPSEALKRLGEHPLYGALEGSGLASVAGRGLGTAAREISGGHFGGTERADLPVRGTPIKVKRRYSPDLIRQGFQRAYDRTPKGREVRPDTLRGRHFLKEAANRFESGEEAIRKAHIHEDLHALKKALPSKWGRIDHKSAEVVNLAVERIIRHPETFSEDLPHYRKMLEVAAKELGPDGKPVLDRYQAENNKALIKQIQHAESLGPERVHATVHSANRFIELQQPILKEMVDLKLIDPEQAAKASAVSFARVHMGSDYGVPNEKQPLVNEKAANERHLANVLEKARAENADPAVIDHLAEEHAKAIRSIRSAEDRHSQHIDANGDPLSLQQITAEMQRQGIEPPGFLSHRAPTAGDYFQHAFGGSTLESGARSGESVATGSQLGGIEALVRQLRRSRGLVDRARAWNKAISRFGIEVKGVKTWGDAKRVLRDPERYGLDPAARPTVVPRYPFMSKKNEIQGALEHQNPEVAGEGASGIVADALDTGKKLTEGKTEIPDDTPVVFFPGKVADQLREGAAPAGGFLRGAQAATTLFTRTVLPFSPGWYIGNGLDNALRTFAAGINPAHLLVGEKVRRSLTPEQQAELLAGAHYSSVSALNPHRSVDSIVRGDDVLSKTVRKAAEWSDKRGPVQAAVTFGPKALSQSSNLLIHINKFITEDLPQRGALGKAALAELKDTQGSWVKALANFKAIGDDFQKKIVDPDKMIQAQKDLETVYGNYSRMSPKARILLRNISPFWAWFRAAYKFVYATMPAHHPILTAALTAGSRATEPIRQEYGLDPEGEKPLPSYMQGGIPEPGGGIFPAGNYTSFGYASNPVESVANLAFPEFQSVREALLGRDWKGDPIKGGNGNKIASALWALGTAFIPGAPLFAKESEGKKEIGPTLPNLPHSYSPGYVGFKRTPTEEITVPKSSGSSSSSGFSGSGFVSGYGDQLSAASTSGGFVQGYGEELSK